MKDARAIHELFEKWCETMKMCGQKSERGIGNADVIILSTLHLLNMLDFCVYALFLFFSYSIHRAPFKEMNKMYSMLANLLAQVYVCVYFIWVSFETCYEGKFRIEKPNMANGKTRKMCAELKKEIIFGKMWRRRWQWWWWWWWWWWQRVVASLLFLCAPSRSLIRSAVHRMANVEHIIKWVSETNVYHAIKWIRNLITPPPCT